MNLYAESSAVRAWLLDEISAADVRRSLAEAADRRARLTAAASHWQILRVAPEIMERVRQPFPGEPIRTLDAIHLASALTARTAIVGLTLLSLDDRVRKAGKKVGLDVIPE
jgi:predicted nucleic acid-binding protein